MSTNSYTALADWRRVHRISRSELAALLGTSTETVAEWEEGRDIPTALLGMRLRDVLDPMADVALRQRHAKLAAETDLSALFDLDGVRLLATSPALRAIWPKFSSLIDVPFIEHLTSTSRTLLHSAEFVRSARRGEVALVTGVSDIHTTLGDDPCVRHHWAAKLRPFGKRMVLDITFSPCAVETPLGLRRVLSVHEL